eukprot:m.438560 g.438560  ORF g.438560 m.438560 type:complete len:144 (+) comp21445_c0_seq18:1150-1581(+)
MYLVTTRRWLSHTVGSLWHIDHIQNTSGNHCMNTGCSAGELKEWEVEAARKAKENEMEAERLREEANRAARKANERRLEAERMHAEAKRNEAEARRRADEQEQARRDKEASEEAERQRMCGYTTTPPRGCTHRHHSSDNTNTQ